MKKITFQMLIAAVALAVVVTSPSQAGQEKSGTCRNMPSFSEFDADGNGVIAADEFYKARSERIAKHAKEGRPMKNLANAPSFEDLDTDGDAEVSRDEFSAHQAGHKMGKRRPGQGRKAGPEPE